MERVMSVEDKIRRAEEIYYKRREQENPRLRSGYERNKERKFGYSIKLLKKMITQIIICLMIYAVFYSVVSNDYVFSKDFTNKAKEIAFHKPLSNKIIANTPKVALIPYKINTACFWE